MQALVFHGANELSMEDMPRPKPGPGEVLVEVSVCGICGSDVHGYLGHSPRRSAHTPLIMGHEFTGRVVEIGNQEPGDSIAIGDRVVVQPQISCGHCRACRAGLPNICPNMLILGIERAGAFAPYVTVPADRVFRLPAGLDDLTGALAETLAVEVHLFRNLSAPLLRTVVVLGAGAQGLLAVQLARLAGAAQVIVSDVMPHRLELAQQMGATTIIHASREDVTARVKSLTEDWGAELVVDTAGAPITRQQGLASLAPGGTLSLIGLGKGETTLDFVPVVGKELSIRGSYCYSDDDFVRAIELLASGQVRVSDMIQVAPLSEGVTYFDRLTRQPDGLTKVLLKAQ